MIVDGTKTLVGRTRHILVDTEGFLLSVVVQAASLPDRKGGQQGLAAAGAGGQQGLAAAGRSFPRLQHLWADQGYTATLVRWTAQEHGAGRRRNMALDGAGRLSSPRTFASSSGMRPTCSSSWAMRPGSG